MRFFLIDHVRGAELLLFGIFRIAETEQDDAPFSGRKLHLQPQYGDRSPAGGNAAEGRSLLHGDRFIPATKTSEERVTVRIETFDRGICRKEGVMVPAFAVFGLVIDGTALCLDLADIPVALEIGLIIHRIPEAPLHAAVDVQVLFFRTLIRQYEFPDLHVGMQRDRNGQFRTDAVLFSLKDRVAEPVPAAVKVKGRPGRQERRAPDRFAVADVEKPPALVGRYVVVAETGDPPQLCILIKTVSSAGIADQRKESFVSQIVCPRQRRIRPRDDVFPCLIVKIAVPHIAFPPIIRVKELVITEIRLISDIFSVLID